jgi:hypothetical protein
MTIRFLLGFTLGGAVALTLTVGFDPWVLVFLVTEAVIIGLVIAVDVRRRQRSVQCNGYCVDGLRMDPMCPLHMGIDMSMSLHPSTNTYPISR